MHIAIIDQASNNGTSFFHRAAPITKIAMTVLLLTAVISSQDPIRLVLLLAGIIVLFIVAGLPLKEIGHLALYPAFFSTLFALFEMQQSVISGVMIILRGVGAALTMLFLISTTSYVDIFGVLALFMPPLLVDMLIFTYRSLFIILDRIGNLLKSIRLRGGYRPFNLISNIKNMAGAVAVLMLHSFEMGERMYKIYSLRGYKGAVPVPFRWKQLKYPDVLIIGLSVLVLVGVLI